MFSSPFGHRGVLANQPCSLPLPLGGEEPCWVLHGGKFAYFGPIPWQIAVGVAHARKRLTMLQTRSINSLDIAGSSRASNLFAGSRSATAAEFPRLMGQHWMWEALVLRRSDGK